MQEGEMASWLHYPINNDDHDDSPFCGDFINPPSTVNNNSSMQTLQRTSQLTEFRRNSMSVAPSRPPNLLQRRSEQVQPNFAYFA
ncbi:transcription factor PIF1-like, partial [Trifolium medium]|nr:transcription factor PIF1-like [Trifolium medium]